MSYKKHILASLLIAFSFIVIHDLFIVTIDADAQNEICLHQTDQTSLLRPDFAVFHAVHQGRIANHLPTDLTSIGKSSETFEEISLFISSSSPILDRPPTS